MLTPNESRRRDRGFPWKGWLLLVAIVGFAIFRSWIGTLLDSFTIDEPYHLVAGTSYVRTGDFRLNPEHPPLMKLWLGAWMPESFKLRPFRPLNEKVEERDFTEETVFYDNDAAAAQARTRASLWSLHALLLVALGALVWHAAGLAWAAGVLGFIALEPTMMAHAPVAMTDLPLALTLLVTAAAAALAFTSWRWRWMLVLGLAIGLTLGAKHSALPGLLGIGIVGGVAAVCSSGRDRWIRLGKLATAGMIGWIFLWTMYAGHFHAAPDGSDPFNRPLAQKIGDLHGLPRTAIALADQWRIFPRAYLWGLADTVRTGVEGRELRTLFFGRWFTGRAPFYFWLGLIASKIPLFLLLLSSVGVVALWRAPLSREARALLLCTGAFAAAHLLALISSQGTWGGIRHALPLVGSLSILAGAAIWRAAQLRSRALGLACAACLALALVTTIREPRLWEYSNALVGGSEGAYRNFRNEGQDLGQRYAEFKTLYDDLTKPTGKPVYSGDYWAFIEEQAQADHIKYTRFCERLDDTNTAAVYDGYFLVGTSGLIPVPHEHWDPAVYRGLERVARLGNLVVLRGRWIAPEQRAYSLRGKVIEAIYKDPKPDWNLLADKLAEVQQAIPWSSATAILHGNTCLKANRAADAITAYEHAWREMDPADSQRPDVARQLARVRAGESLGTIEPLPSKLLE